MMGFVIDAYAWVEYFDGTPAGKRVAEIIENKNSAVYTNVITIAELADHFQRRGVGFETAREIINSVSLLYSITADFAAEAGKLHADLKKSRKNISMADVFVLLTAQKLKAKVVTGDEDFRGLPEVIMIKEKK